MSCHPVAHSHTVLLRSLKWHNSKKITSVVEPTVLLRSSKWFPQIILLLNMSRQQKDWVMNMRQCWKGSGNAD